MGDKTKISWTEASWNPIRAKNIYTGKTGWHCEHVTEACRNCYAERQNARAGDSGGTGYAYKPGHLDKDVEVYLDEKTLLIPLKWKRGRKIFVCSMTDLFADFVPDEWLDRIFAVMAIARHHTFQVLTKRPERMREYVNRLAKSVKPLEAGARSVGHTFYFEGQPVTALPWPIPNIWLGTSICDQPDADKFLPDLIATPAAVHFVSAEPLLGRINLAPWLLNIQWVIVGGESGPLARATHPNAFRDLRDQCAAFGVSFHFKQHGEFVSVSEVAGAGAHFKFPDGTTVRRVGTRKAGRTLDGIEHNGFPA